VNIAMSQVNFLAHIVMWLHRLVFEKVESQLFVC